MQQVEDAVILAGGIGTRMLPASLFAPKEVLPLIDTPLISHLVWEANKAGVKKIHVVLSQRKKTQLQYFFDQHEIYDETIRTDLARESLTLGINGVEIISYVQESANGVAGAISQVLDKVSGPFLVLLGDNLLLSNHVSPSGNVLSTASDACLRLVTNYEEHGLPCVGVYQVDKSEVSKYGVVEISDQMVTGIVEKPDTNNAPGNNILCGRYLLPANTGNILRKYPVSKFGELQSILMLKHLINNQGLLSVSLDDMELYDSGDPISWLKAQIDHGMRREDISTELIQWLRNKMGIVV